MKRRVRIAHSTVGPIQLITKIIIADGRIAVGTAPVLVVVPVCIASTARPDLIVGHNLQVDEDGAVASVHITLFLEWQTERIVIALTYIEVLSEIDTQTVILLKGRVCLEIYF